MIIQSWDTAIKAGRLNDYSVCLTFRYHPAGDTAPASHQLLDCWRDRLEYPELKRRVLGMAATYEPEAILIEDKASGQSLLQDLRRETSLPVIGILPVQDKLSRVAHISPIIEAGQVALPKWASWLDDFEQEVRQFPTGAHDDQIDALSQYLNWMRSRQYRHLQIKPL